MLNITSGSNPSVPDKLDTLNVITAEGVKAIRLNASQQIYFLNTTNTTSTLLTVENI